MKMKDGNCRYVEKAHKGQELRTEAAPDKSSHMVASKHDALMGREMAGGPRDVSHSLGSAGAVPAYPPARGSKTNYGKDKGKARDNNYMKGGGDSY